MIFGSYNSSEMLKKYIWIRLTYEKKFKSRESRPPVMDRVP